MSTYDNSQERPEKDSLQKRYSFKLLNNLFNVVFNFLLQSLVPRAIGPKAYGDYTFLFNFFSQIISLIDMATMTFYPRLSKNPGDSALISLYWFISGGSFFLIFVVIAFIDGVGGAELIWPEQRMVPVLMAAVLACLIWTFSVLKNMADACGHTVESETALMVQKVFGSIMLTVFFLWHLFNLEAFFLLQWINMGFAVILLGRVLHKHERIFHRITTSVAALSEPAREMLRHASHLIPVFAVLFVSSVFDRWLLQKVSGSEQQGYYGIAYQVASLCFMFTAAFTPLVIREYSIAHGNKDNERLRMLFQDMLPPFFVLAAYFGCFVALQADKILMIIGGPKFVAAVPILSIMAFYPIHQTYGQLSGSLFVAMGDTVRYRNVNYLYAFISIVSAWLMLAPTEYGGLKGGGLGLAVKMIVVQLIITNFQLYLNTRELGISMKRFVIHQLFSISILFFSAAVVKGVVDSLLPAMPLVSFIVAGLLYTLLAGVIVVRFPRAMLVPPHLWQAAKKALKTRFNRD